jgi:copper chaperone CopZ
MKKTMILGTAMLLALSFTSCKDQAQTKENLAETQETTDVNQSEMAFGVRGNCGMCKKTIEKAARSVDGVASAEWNRTQKRIAIQYDAQKADAMGVQEAIAAAGYDTEQIAADENAYKNLPDCCQYDRSMAMNQTDASDANHEDHAH